VQKEDGSGDGGIEKKSFFLNEREKSGLLGVERKEGQNDWEKECELSGDGIMDPGNKKGQLEKRTKKSCLYDGTT